MRGSLQTRYVRSFPTRRSSDLQIRGMMGFGKHSATLMSESGPPDFGINSWLEDELYQQYLHDRKTVDESRSEEHTSELQSRVDIVCRLLLEKKKKYRYRTNAGR